jgi:hypothetical protein
MRLAIILIVALAFAVSTAWAAGCPAGTKQRCVQTKKGVECYCR